MSRVLSSSHSLPSDLDKPVSFLRNCTTMKTTISLSIIPILIVCLGLASNIQAVIPPPDGGYPGGNTAEGQHALFNLTTGTYNTAIGLYSLLSLNTGNYNTGIGA